MFSNLETQLKAGKKLLIYKQGSLISVAMLEEIKTFDLLPEWWGANVDSRYLAGAHILPALRVFETEKMTKWQKYWREIVSVMREYAEKEVDYRYMELLIQAGKIQILISFRENKFIAQIITEEMEKDEDIEIACEDKTLDGLLWQLGLYAKEKVS